VSQLPAVPARVAAIRYAHKLAGHAVPTDDERVKATVRGIRRALGTAARKKAPATAEQVISMALGTGDGLKGLRDLSTERCRLTSIILNRFAPRFAPCAVMSATRRSSRITRGLVCCDAARGNCLGGAEQRADARRVYSGIISQAWIQGLGRRWDRIRHRYVWPDHQQEIG
jgi:hypothetical protein